MFRGDERCSGDFRGLTYIRCDKSNRRHKLDLLFLKCDSVFLAFHRRQRFAPTRTARMGLCESWGIFSGK